ncbi:MAG: YraN family protein [Oscillospiraceae bacterium]|nr:YraN family protein [Oscillospiraceae bacterium]
MNEQGKRGEQIALQYLQKKGYDPLEINWHSVVGEIDLIMIDKEYIIFVEVKMRNTGIHGMPQEFVSKSKQNKLRKTAQAWFAAHPGCTLQPRFDVVAILAPGGGFEKLQIEHIQNAF